MTAKLDPFLVCTKMDHAYINDNYSIKLKHKHFASTLDVHEISSVRDV